MTHRFKYVARASCLNPCGVFPSRLIGIIITAAERASIRFDDGATIAGMRGERKRQRRASSRRAPPRGAPGSACRMRSADGRGLRVHGRHRFLPCTRCLRVAAVARTFALRRPGFHFCHNFTFDNDASLTDTANFSFRKKNPEIQNAFNVAQRRDETTAGQGGLEVGRRLLSIASKHDNLI